MKFDVLGYVDDMNFKYSNVSRPGYRSGQLVQPGPGRAGKGPYNPSLSGRGQKIIKAVKEYNNLLLKDFNKGNLVNTETFAQFAGKKYGPQLVKAQSDMAYIYPEVKEFKLQRLDTARDNLFKKLINEANQGEQFVDFPSIAKKISKTAPIVHTSTAYRKLLDTKSDKVKKVFNNMIKNEEPLHLVGKGHKHLWDANPLLKIIGQRADVKSAALMRDALDTDPFYKKNKKLIKFAGDARLMDYGKPLSEILEQADYRIGGGVQWSYGRGKRPAKDVAETINDFALKHWNYHKRNQTGNSQIEFYSKKNNKPISWEKVSQSPRTGVKSLISTDVYFKYKNDPKQRKWSLGELRKSGRAAGIFDEVYKTRYSYQNMMNKMVTNPVNPTGRKIRFGQLMSKVFKEGFDDASSPYAIDHIKGVAQSPFNDLRLASTRTNLALSYINKYVPQKNFKKTLVSELMGGATDFKSKQYVKDLVKQGEGLAKEVLVGGKKVPISSVQEVGGKFLKPSKFKTLTGPQKKIAQRMAKADTYKAFKTLPVSYGVGSTFAGVADDFLKTKTAKNIGTGLKKVGAGAFGPTGAAGLWAGFGGIDLKDPWDRGGLAAEAALAPSLVTSTEYASKGIKNPLVKQGVQRALNLGMSLPMAMRAARIASPIGWLSLAGEGIYHAGKREMARREQMSPQELEDFHLERQSRGWNRMGQADGGITNVRRPWAIPPESGPMPQGGGLSSQFNRVKKLTE